MSQDKRHVGAQATRTAIARLIEKHQDEYETLLGDAREEAGLQRTPGPQKKLSRLEMLRLQLREQGIDPVA